MFAKLLFVKKHGSGDRGYLHRTDMKKLLKNQTAGQISKQFHRYVPWMNLLKISSRNFDTSRNMAVMKGGYLHYMEMKKKKSSSLKSLINFKIVSQKYSLRDPFQKLFTKLLSVYSHGSGCEDLFALQGDNKNFLFLLH